MVPMINLSRWHSDAWAQLYYIFSIVKMCVW